MDHNKKRIAKNTVYLYCRMILLMVVSLYTSRIVLNALGIVDYGIYNVVGGVVYMLGFLNSSLTSTTQRFLNVEMTSGDVKMLNVIFVQAVNTHILIGFLAFVILESLGLWFIQYKLVIPKGQLSAALWVFQCSILSFLLTVLSSPYNAAIIANEKMSLFAWLSVLDGILRLGVAFIVSSLPNERLKTYGILVLCVSIIMRIAYGGCCIKFFKECRYKFMVRWEIMKRMFSFSAWMIFGSLSDILAGQGVNMLINIFFGPVFNAARAIAVQVQSAVSQFSTNFMMSVNPQIVKQYSSGAITESFKLVFQSSKLSFFLMLLIVVPVVVRMNDILHIWLEEVPTFTTIFAQLILLEYLVRSSYTPIAQINVASGNVRYYQLAVAGLYIIIFVGSYLLFKFKFPVYSVFVLSLSVALIGLFVRLIILKVQNKFPMFEYLKYVSFPLFAVCCVSLLISQGFSYMFTDSFIGSLGSCAVSIFFTAISCWFIGLNSMERLTVSSKVSMIINKLR